MCMWVGGGGGGGGVMPCDTIGFSLKPVGFF
jgi:hypothetical protein